MLFVSEKTAIQFTDGYILACMYDELFNYLSELIDVTGEEMAEFRKLDVIKSFPKGHVLLREGEISNRTFFVFKGCLRVFYLIDGEEITTAFYTERHVISPETVVSGKPSAYYLVCVEDCMLNVSTPDMEEAFLTKHPHYERLCRKMGEKIIADKQLSFDTYRLASAEQRYLHLMETNPQLLNRVPLYQLASFIGVKPESLSRIRKRIASKTTRVTS